ncbi:MAG: hypothetical protein K2H40_03510 [Lachnospiraceae bacterium]|nr:hypothetical protein [Lachnospiraceae bacterium]
MKQKQLKQERIIAGADILATQMNHWTLFSIVITAAILGKREPPFALWTVCALLPALFFFIRRYTNHFLIMAGSHLLCLIFLFSAPVSGLAVKALVFLYGIGLAIYSFSLRIRTEERLDGIISPAVAVGIIALSLFLLHYEEHFESDICFVGIVALYFIGYYIRHYLLNYLYFLTVNTGSTGYIPRREIFLSGAKLSFTFTLTGMAVVLLVSNWNWLAQLFGALRQGMIWLREKGFFALIASFFQQEAERPSTRINNLSPANPASMALEPGEAGLFWQILEKIVGILVPVLLLLLLGLFLFRFIKMVCERFRRKKLFVNNISGSDVRDIREKYEIKKEKKNQKDFGIFLRPTQRIRRLYKQRIWTKRERLFRQENPRSLNAYTALSHINI